jgi:hypothetical protein
VKATIGELISAYWAMGEKSPAIQQAMLQGSGIPEDEIVAAITRIRAGTPAADALDDRFVDAYAIAGNADDCVAAMTRFGAIGVTELIVTFVGAQPTVDMVYLAGAMKAAG